MGVPPRLAFLQEALRQLAQFGRWSAVVGAVAHVTSRYPGVFQVWFRNRKGKKQLSRTYFIRYTVRGKQQRESTGETTAEAAWKVRLERLRQIGQGIEPNPDARKVTAAQLGQLVHADLDARGKVTAHRLHEWTAPVAEFFGPRPMLEVKPADLLAYVSHRKGAGIAPGTIDVELRWLRRGYRLAMKSDLLPRVPEFPKLEFDNARRVFADWPVVERLLPFLPDFLRPVVLTAHFSGWRQTSILNRERALHLDLEQRLLYLERLANKGRSPVMIWLNDALFEVMREQDERAREIERRTGRLVPWVFFYYEDGPNRVAGAKVGSISHVWNAARAAAGMPNLRFHDLRRGAVRDLRRDGDSEHEIMSWVGLRSRTMLDRYDIIDEERVKEIGERQQRRHERRVQGKVQDINRKP